MDDLDFDDIPIFEEDTSDSSFAKAYIEPFMIWIFTNPTDFFFILAIVMGPLMIASAIASYKLLRSIEKDEKKKKAQIKRRLALKEIQAKKFKPHKTD